MKYPYYNPNLRFSIIVKSLFLSEKAAEEIIKTYFTKLTEKKHVLITNSCRTALYLTYKILEKTGEVITTPLTCKVAIDPIVESGNTPVFADVNIQNLNIDTNDIAHRLNELTVAIQAVHHGGLACDMNEIVNQAKTHKLKIIEDCAQSLGTKYKESYVGSFGDFACFSLTKNAYGIAGGVMATNDFSAYEKAKKIEHQLSSSSSSLVYYRALRNILESNNNYWLCRILLKGLFFIKGRKRNYSTIDKQLKRIHHLELKIAALQIGRLKNLHKKRIHIGSAYIRQLDMAGILDNKACLSEHSSFTKLFVYNQAIESKILIKKLHKSGIQAMHLENSHWELYQDKLAITGQSEEQELDNYEKVHDHIIALPLHEKMKEKDINYIVGAVQKILKK